LKWFWNLLCNQTLLHTRFDLKNYCRAKMNKTTRKQLMNLFMLPILPATAK